MFNKTKGNMKITDLKEWEVLIGTDKYVVIAQSSKYTLEVFNFSTWEEETIEGDYLENGDISHYDFDNKGDFDFYIEYSKMSEQYEEKLKNKVAELKEFYS